MAGEQGSHFMTHARGSSNDKAKHALDWQSFAIQADAMRLGLVEGDSDVSR